MRRHPFGAVCLVLLLACAAVVVAALAEAAATGIGAAVP